MSAASAQRRLHGSRAAASVVALPLDRVAHIATEVSRAALPLMLLTALLGACAPAAPASPPTPDRARVILLLGGDTFGGSDRVARTLDDMAAATDVLGNSAFVLEAPAGCRPADLPVLLARHPDAAVAIAVVGGLALLDGVDPSRPPEDPVRLSSRTVALPELEAALLRLEQTARAQGTLLVLATAPLGRQARVEVPELATVADALRARGPVLDLERLLAAHEPAPLHENGIDRLDARGHDELARAIFAACCEDGGPLPPRDAAERSARLQARALAAFRAGNAEAFAALAARVAAEPGPPPGARDAVRRAAIATARDGLLTTRAAWESLPAPEPGGAAATPGLRLGRLLAGLPGPAPTLDDAVLDPGARGADFEGELVAALAAVQRLDPEARTLAERCVAEHPERIEGWLVLQLVAISPDHLQDVRPEARRHLALFARGATGPTLETRLLSTWPVALEALPALLLAGRPFERLEPTGPLLENARRRAALGYVDHALELLDTGLEGLRVPPAWARERARIDALPRG